MHTLSRLLILRKLPCLSIFDGQHIEEEIFVAQTVLNGKTVHTTVQNDQTFLTGKTLQTVWTVKT